MFSTKGKRRDDSDEEMEMRKRMMRDMPPDKRRMMMEEMEMGRRMKKGMPPG